MDIITPLYELPEEFSLTPVTGKKAPYRPGWQTEPTVDRKEIEKDLRSGKAKGFGLRTGKHSNNILALDIDGTSAMVLTLKIFGGELPHTVSFTSGRVDRRQLLFRIPPDIADKIKSKKIRTGGTDKDPEYLELRWNGLQSVLPPSAHPETGSYIWLASPATTEIIEAPYTIISLLMPSTNKLDSLDRQNPQKWSGEDWARSYLKALSSRRVSSYDDWIKVGMALHSISPNLLSDWESWSRGSEKFKDGECRKKWDSFASGGPVSIQALGAMAKEDGWTFDKSDFPSNREFLNGRDRGYDIRDSNSAVNTIYSSISDRSNSTSERPRLSAEETQQEVEAILNKKLKAFIEVHQLAILQNKSELGKDAFAELVLTSRLKCDTVSEEDYQDFEKVLRSSSEKLDLDKVLPDLAKAMQNDAAKACIEPIVLLQYLLPACGSLIGTKTKLLVNGWFHKPIVWMMVVLRSGGGKTRAEHIITDSLKDKQISVEEKYKAEHEQYLADVEAYRRKKKGDDLELPIAPKPKRSYIFEGITPEAMLFNLSLQKTNGVLWSTDEFMTVIKGISQYTKNGSGNGMEQLGQCWDGRKMVVNRRRKEDDFFIKESCLNMAAGIQNDNFSKAFVDNQDSSGFAARFLFAIPEVLDRKYVTGRDFQLTETLDGLYTFLDNFNLEDGYVKISASAEAMWAKVYESMGREIMQSSGAMSAWLAKADSHTLRIALILHCIECYFDAGKNPKLLSKDTLERAIYLVGFYRRQLEIILSTVGSSSQENSDMTQVLNRIHKLATVAGDRGITIRDIYRQIPSLQKDAKLAKINITKYVVSILDILIEKQKGRIEQQGRSLKYFAIVQPVIIEPVEEIEPQTDKEMTDYLTELFQQLSQLPEGDRKAIIANHKFEFVRDFFKDIDWE